MSIFLRLLKYSRYIGHLSKRILIDDANIPFRGLSHVSSNVASTGRKSDDCILEYEDNKKSKIPCINDLITKVNNSHKSTGIIPKHYMEQIIQHLQENIAQIGIKEIVSILTCSRLLPQCNPEERIKLSTTIWNLATTRCIPVDVCFYNELLKIYIQNEHQFSPLDILYDMQNKGVSPNKDTYQCLLEYYCKKGKMSQVANILKCMKEKKYPISRNILNLLILGYSQAGNLTGAIGVLHTMKKMSITPSARTYTAIMCAYAKVNDIRNLTTILACCKKKNIRLSSQCVLDVIYTSIVNNNMSTVQQISIKIKNLDRTAVIYFLSKIIDTKQEDYSLLLKALDFTLPKMKKTADYNEVILFLINKIINMNMPLNKIIEILIHLEEKYNYKNAFSEAILISYRFCNDKMALDLLTEWKTRGHKLRSHYFWPILKKFIEKHDVHNLLYFMKEMITTYNVTPCVSTVANFFVPYIFYNPYDLRYVLHEHGLSHKTIDNAIVYDLLQNNKMRRAASQITTHINFYEHFELMDVLIKGLYNTCDISSFFVIVTNLHEETEPGNTKTVSRESAIHYVTQFLDSRPGYTPQVIQYLYINKWKISKDVSDILSRYLRVNSSSDASKQLEHITENHLVSEEKDKDKVLPYNESVSRLNSLLQENLIEEAVEMIKSIVTNHPFVSTVNLVLDKVKHLISLGYFNEAVKIIELTSETIQINYKHEINSRIKDLLITVVEKGNEVEIHDIFNALSEAEYLLPSDNILHPSMMVYIQRGDATKALEIAELLCEKYQYIPDLTKLTELIITTENTNLLQRFIDITTKVYEPQYILGELLVRFLEKGYEKEAKRITELFVTSNYKFTNIKASTSIYDHKKSAKILSNLLDCMKEACAETNDRLFIYKCLFDIYKENNDYQSGSLLWRRMNEEGTLPSKDIVQIFENLKEHNDTDKHTILE